MFDAKEEKASFKLENERKPNVHHFGDRYIQYKLKYTIYIYIQG